MHDIKIGIIGIGGAGRAHAYRFLRHKSVARVIGYDIKEIDFSKIEIIKSFDEFISSVDAVSICTPDYCHYEYIKKCILNNKHVLVEKPMVANFKEAVALNEILQNNLHVKFAIHHQMRFVPAFNKAKELIKNGELGDLFYVEANYWHDMRIRNTLFDDWRIKGKGQSVIFGGACHPLDLILYLINEEVIDHKTFLSKNSYKEFPLNYTSATTILKFKSNVIAKCHTNNSVIFPQFNNLIVLGDKGSFIDGILYKNNKFINVAQYFNRIANYRYRQYINSKLINLALHFLTKHHLFRSSPFSIYNHEYACQVIIDNFVNAIVKDERVLVGYEDGCKVVKLCEETEAEGLGYEA